MSSKLDNPVDGPLESPSSLLSLIVGFYFGFRVVTVLFLTRVFDADPRTGTAVNLATDYFLLLLCAFCSVGCRYPFGEMARLPGVRWALLFLGFSCCSLLWSRTASLPDSMAYWCGMAADFIMVAMLLRSGETERVSRSLMKGFVWGACAVAAVAWVLPAQSDLRLGDEELLGPNQIGYVCAFAFFFAQYLVREKKEKMGAPATFLAITVLRALSKTTIAAFLAGEGFLLLMDKKMARRTKVLLVIGTLVAVALFWGLLI
ncbi:MAG TPA: oligosaccharide repeat unit polymerase, partial [Candidatus Angelobacter sp.]|nr:oligosaccharide repeat unit polymerase [Candidatus Angelobacter sp.]